MLEEPSAVIEKAVTPKSPVVNPEPKKSLGSLDTIRKKISTQNKANGAGEKELNEEELQIFWGRFIDKLIAKQKHSAVTNFKMAQLRIVDNTSIEIITGTNIQQKFIEHERAELVDDLQQYFCNRLLTYSVIIDEKESGDTASEKPLSSREQYLKIIEEYPMVKELKDRLRLELDY